MGCGEDVMPCYGLWGVFQSSDADDRAACQLLVPHCANVLLLSQRPAAFWPRQADVLLPRAEGALAAWLSVWQDTPAQGIIWLKTTAARPAVIAALAACHGRVRSMGHESAAYFSRACLGAGLRLYRQGARSLPPLLKVLKTPCL